MEHKPALYALLKLHAELGANILAHRKESDRLRTDMKHVEAVIRMLEPGYDVRRIAVKRRYNPNPVFKRGECFRVALGILRTAGEPLTVRELAVRVLASRGVVDPTPATRHIMEGAMRSSLGNHEGSTVCRVGTETPAKWQVVV